MKHKVIALVSGGKDSCYSMTKCVEYGHEIIAIGHLAPKNVETGTFAGLSACLTRV